MGDVENPDWVNALLRAAGGAVLALEASRVGVVRLLTGPPHWEYGAFQPGAGIALGYDDLKVIEAAAFVGLITRSRGGPMGATLADAVRSAEVLDAMERSAHEQRWVKLAP